MKLGVRYCSTNSKQGGQFGKKSATLGCQICASHSFVVEVHMHVGVSFIFNFQLDEGIGRKEVVLMQLCTSIDSVLSLAHGNA